MRGLSRVVLGCGALYFLLVFGCGFALGVPRTLWLVPRLGERWAELIEVPIMLGVIYLVARWINRRFLPEAAGRSARLGVGLVGLTLLLAAELGFVLQLRGVSPSEDLAGRDPVSGAAYALSLLLFAAMPALLGREGS